MTEENDAAAEGSLVEEALKLSHGETLLKPPPSKDYIYPLETFPATSAFDISVPYPAIILPARLIATTRKELSHVLLKRAKLKVIHPLLEDDPVPSGNDEDRGKFRKLLLTDQQKGFDDPKLQALLKDQPNDFCKSTHLVTASYSDWAVEQVLRRIIPVEEIPSAFETIGHLAHINLRDELLPFKYIVGKVILDKNSPKIKTVVNKTGNIQTKFRTFGMEVIAGDDTPGWSEVVVKEEGCKFEMDFRKVYWNSRLGGEHRRLVKLIQDEADSSPEPVVVADLMAGIGPFAVPLTARGDDANLSVHANDLNPESYKYLVANSKRNKCKKLHCYNMDGRAFCHKLQDEGIDFHHVLMNLPATAPEFIDAFRGFRGKTLPRIHVHCFSSKEGQESGEGTVKRCETALGCSIDATECNVYVHMVRNVAPNKNMYCVSFTLPEAARSVPAISVGTTTADESSDEPEAKRTKLC
eukprot:Nitzschia sp. Nitz4//scaffold389_size11954//7601//9004//NITZ4_009012-RA/size11954-processed-gene-0.3-mRNA-1//1//CDS//3329549999//5491//frame0